MMICRSEEEGKMIEKDKETNTYHAICDCCYQQTEGYDTFKHCQHGIKEDGWKAHYNKDEELWEHFCSDCVQG